jgi:hypothetical protein
MIAQPPPHFEVFSDSAALRRARGQRPPCSARPGVWGLDQGVGPLAASGSCHSPAAPAAKRRRGRRREAERVPMAETGSAAHARCPRFSQARSAVMVQAPGRLYIGGSAYFVWADPPNGGCTARRLVAGHRRTPAARSTSKPLWVKCEGDLAQGVGPPNSPGARQAPQPHRQEACTDSTVTWSTPQWPTR